MYRKILVPLDGSKTAESVLPLARSLVTRLNLPVELLGVIDLVEPGRSPARTQGCYISTLVDDETRRRSAYLEKTAKSFSGVVAKCAVEKGRAADVIIETAAMEKNTLIMIATHGRSGLNRFLLGSVAEKVLRGTSNPLLLVRATEGTNITGDVALKS